MPTTAHCCTIRVQIRFTRKYPIDLEPHDDALGLGSWAPLQQEDRQPGACVHLRARMQKSLAESYSC